MPTSPVLCNLPDQVHWVAEEAYLGENLGFPPSSCPWYCHDTLTVKAKAFMPSSTIFPPTCNIWPAPYMFMCWDSPCAICGSRLRHLRFMPRMKMILWLSNGSLYLFLPTVNTLWPQGIFKKKKKPTACYSPKHAWITGWSAEMVSYCDHKTTENGERHILGCIVNFRTTSVVWSTNFLVQQKYK